MKKIFILFLLGICTYPSLVHAQKFSIVASVNGQSISNFELFDRMDLTIKSSGIKDSPELRKKIMGQILQTLINEKLQQEYAKKYDITTSQKDEERAINIIMQKNKISPEKTDDFLASQGISKSSFIKQLRAEVTWQKIIGKRISPYISISDFEIAQATEQLNRSTKIVEVDLHEILLTIEDSTLSTDVLQLANNLVTEIRNGASFHEVAKEFSASNSAPKGGRLGWIAEKNLEASIATVISKTPPKNITIPIVKSDNIRIFYVKDRRTKKEEVKPKQIRQFLQQQKTSLESRKLMKELRKNAMIEIKN